MSIFEINDLKKDALDTLRQEGLPVTDYVVAYESLDFVENYEWQRMLHDLNKKFTPEVMKGIIKKELLASIQRLRDYREGQYALNDELRAKGIPFTDRMKQINCPKIEWTTQFETKLTQDMNRFRVRPFNEWLDRIDLKSAKVRGEGMGFIIRGNITRCYIVDSN